MICLKYVYLQLYFILFFFFEILNKKNSIKTFTIYYNICLIINLCLFINIFKLKIYNKYNNKLY